MAKLADFRYYLYISTAKVEMLYDQLIETPRRAKASLTVAGVGGSLDTTSEAKISQNQKILAIEKELEERRLIGSVEDPKDYFKGLMSMRWGLFDDGGQRPKDEPPLVYFSGFDSSAPLVVGLGGSSRHVVGYQGATSAEPRSYGPVIVRWLLAGLEDRQPEARWWDNHTAEEYAVFGGMASALHSLRPPTQEIEFVAKTLLTGTIRGHEHFLGVPEAKAILGTPLYAVAAYARPDADHWGLDPAWSAKAQPERTNQAD